MKIRSIHDLMVRHIVHLTSDDADRIGQGRDASATIGNMPNIVSKDPELFPQLLGQAAAVLVIVGRRSSPLEGCGPFADARWFRRHFSDLRARHGLRSVSHGISFRYPSLVMEWAFMGRLIALLQDARPAAALADALMRLAGRKPTFVVTANVDGSFRAAGLGEERLFETAGDVTRMTCRWNCDERTFPSEEAVRTMLAPGLAPTISPRHIPRCPRCGGPMTPAIARDRPFSMRSDWAARCYAMMSFLRHFHGKPLLVLELGVGPWDVELKGLSASIMRRNERARYLVVNAHLGYLAPTHHERTVHFDGDTDEALGRLLDGVASR